METTMGAKWGMPAFCLAMGALLLDASALGGQPVIGLGMFALMALYSAVVLVFGGRNETVGVLGGRPFVVVRRLGPGNPNSRCRGRWPTEPRGSLVAPRMPRRLRAPSACPCRWR